MAGDELSNREVAIVLRERAEGSGGEVMDEAGKGRDETLCYLASNFDRWALSAVGIMCCIVSRRLVCPGPMKFGRTAVANICVHLTHSWRQPTHGC